ncbi:hypothetical protein [Methyloceanibacter caenitepidi]|uniref:Uncharacterized protein n=1 Tax=Methyloceanibacter caenitepidi TaxID=1384459 RepID=A0A0A8K0J0_9HYPH|nr:hypothetical protein [Methyloceanibacter caenitepidi]BAQ16306.1 hypothetical protein GL4_0844 [Methyloceanibacter caenitepidi]
MHAFAQALSDPALRGAYLAFSLLLLILPLVLIWLWYRQRDKAGTVDRPMLIRVGLLTLLWMVVNAGALGFLMWAETVKSAGG